MGEMTHLYKILIGKPEGRYDMRELDVDGMMLDYGSLSNIV
jgi:hypothetical protein